MMKFWVLSCREELRSYPKCGIIDISDIKVVPMTGIIKKFEGTINTAVGKIKKNADGHSLDKEGVEQEALGKSQLGYNPGTDKPKKDG